MSFKIESNIPVPQNSSIFPLKDLKPGQSFFVPSSDPNYKKLKFAIKNAKRLHHLSLTTRTLTEGKNEGTRVWCK